jgi:hypothetical protein
VSDRFVARDAHAAAEAPGGRDRGGRQGHGDEMILRDLRVFAACLDITQQMVFTRGQHGESTRRAT